MSSNHISVYNSQYIHEIELSKPETNMTFKKVKKDTVWIDDPDSVYYNTWQSTSSKEKDWESSEALYSRFSKKKSNYCIAFNFNGDCIRKIARNTVKARQYLLTELYLKRI